MLINSAYGHFRVSFLFREDAVRHNLLEPPSASNPGGGLAIKRMQVERALPSANIIVEANQMSAISVVDVLYFSGGGTEDEFNRRVDEYCRHVGFKVLWTSDFEIFRWRPDQRERILDNTNLIAGNSVFMYELLSAYFGEGRVVLLTDPVDCDVLPGAKFRSPVIYSCSHIILEKGIGNVVELYKLLAANECVLERVFVGASDTWGMYIRDLTSFDLEVAIDGICDVHHVGLTHSDVMELARSASVYISFSGYETFGYAVVEAMLGGCHVFVSDHLAYRKRVDAGAVIQVSGASDAFAKIKELLACENVLQNEAAIQFVHDNYSFDVFRKQFRDVVGGLYAV